MSENQRKREDDENDTLVNEAINDIVVDENSISDEEPDQRDVYYNRFDNINEYDNDQNNCRVQRAIFNGKSIDVIKDILDVYPMELQHKNLYGPYPLQPACFYLCNDDIVMLLIELYPQAAQYKTLEGLYPLHIATRPNGKSEDVVMKIIQIFPEAVTESTTNILCWELKGNQSERVIAKLIEVHPLALQETNDNDEYPIHFAVIKRQPIAIVKLLLDNDPLGIQRRSGNPRRNGETPFHLEFEHCNTDFVKYFMQRSDLQIDIRDMNGKTPLHYACRYLGKNIIDELLCHPDIDVNATDNFSDTPLHEMARYCYDNSKSSVDVLQKLLDHPSILINQKNNDNQTPLDLIISHLYRISMWPNVPDEEFLIKMITLLKEFPIKRRWQAYYYHINNYHHL